MTEGGDEEEGERLPAGAGLGGVPPVLLAPLPPFFDVEDSDRLLLMYATLKTRL